MDVPDYYCFTPFPQTYLILIDDISLYLHRLLRLPGPCFRFSRLDKYLYDYYIYDTTESSTFI